MMLSSCGKDTKTELPAKTTLSQLAKQVLFNPLEIQDFQSTIKYFQSVEEDSLTGEESVLKGLAYIYQGELYEVAAEMLSRMQLDLYYKSTDLEHGSKFPITEEIEDIRDELTFWMGVDAYSVYGAKEGLSLLAPAMSDPLYKIKQKIIKTISRNTSKYRDQTFLSFDRNSGVLNKNLPILQKILEAEVLYKKHEYENVLSFLDNEKLYNKNIFVNHKHVIYFSPALFKLAALSHYKLGINALENAFQVDFITQDSTGYRIIAIMNLGQEYRYFEDSVKLSALWDKYKDFLVTQGQMVQILVETNEYMPYCLDWIKFEDAILTVLKVSLPKKLRFLNDSSDPDIEIMKKFIVNPNNPDIYKDIHHVLMNFTRTPKRIDKYPTLISGFMKELNQSQLSYSEKKMIQEVTENLVFNVERSKASWLRNRPAFLLSLYSTLRWHGGRLPDLNGFLIDMRNLDDRLGSLQEIASLFTQELIK